MIIVDNTQVTKHFCDICVGVVFKKEYEGVTPDYCMKVPEILDQCSQEQYNAIDLEEGVWCWFEPYEEVIPYDATLHLEV